MTSSDPVEKNNKFSARGAIAILLKKYMASQNNNDEH
jgi:hypothetical protein